MDIHQEPPEGFTLLYKEERYSGEEIRRISQKISGADRQWLFCGILKVSYGAWNAEGLTDLRMDKDNVNGRNAWDLLKDFAKVTDLDPLQKFLENINIHKMFYKDSYLRRVDLKPWYNVDTFIESQIELSFRENPWYNEVTSGSCVLCGDSW